VSCTIPRLVSVLTQRFDAWVVGSAASPTNVNPRDWDVCVPFGRWKEAATLLPPGASRMNSFGGWKITLEEGVEIDVWPGDLADVSLHHRTKFLWHPPSNTRFSRI
jgi:hypothetical protein